MFVYILESGENYRGGKCIGVFASEKLAMAAMHAYIKKWSGEDKWENKSVQPWEDEVVAYFAYECDWITIKKKPVVGSAPGLDS